MTHGTESGEEAIELRRYADALRRGAPLIAALVVALAVSTYLVSKALPKRYTAEARIVLQNPALSGQSSTDATTRELNTIDALVTTRPLLAQAARQVPGASVSALQDNVKSEADQNANLIHVSATDGSPARAAAIANAVSFAFVRAHAYTARQQSRVARASLQQQLDGLRGRPGSGAQIQLLQQRIADLNVTVNNAGSDLQVAERATAPSAPSSPHPLLNTGVAVVLGLFLGVLVVLARDQLTPRVGSPRDLARLFELPLLVSMPYARRRGRHGRAVTAIGNEAYQTLATSLRFAMPPRARPHFVLVTSAVHGEGKSTATARLGRALSRSGQRTLVVSADLRRPTVHELLDVSRAPGLSEILSRLDAEPAADAHDLVSHHIQPAPGPRGGLDVLPSGGPVSDPAALLSDVPLKAVFRSVGALEYRYVLVDAPALLGVVDARALARLCSGILLVARLDRITLETAVDARHALDAFDCPALGLVVIGGRGTASPYYAGEPVPALEDA
jgi:Mrp family chromosome partitioning ATPase/capsular polysaccharide biosynthesis protein